MNNKITTFVIYPVDYMNRVPKNLKHTQKNNQRFAIHKKNHYFLFKLIKQLSMHTCINVQKTIYLCKK